MNTDRILSVALAACCLFALGASAATLDASVDTTPDDAIDLNAETLPLPSDEAAHLKKQIQSYKSSPQQGPQTTQHQSGAGGGESRQQPRSGSGSDGAGGMESGRLNAPVADDGSGDRSVPEDPTLLERLLALLRGLLDLLVVLVPVAALVGVGVAVVRFRDRVHALLGRLRERLGFGPDGRTDPSGRGRPAPSNEVETAWFEMVSRVGPDEWTRTPRRHAADAVEAGVDPDDAETLTTLFERVRYGGEPVTAGRRQRARHAIQRVRGQLRSEDGQ